MRFSTCAFRSSACWAKALGDGTITNFARRRAAGERVVLFVKRHLRAFEPLLLGLVAFLQLLFQHVLVSDGDGDLHLHLDELVSISWMICRVIVLRLFRARSAH